MNIKQASYLTLAIIVLQVIWAFLQALLIAKVFGKSYYPEYYPIFEMVGFLFYMLPIIFFALKKFDTKVRIQFVAFNPLVFTLFLIVAIFLFANILPFSRPIQFIKSLLDDKLLYFELRNFNFTGWKILGFVNMVIIIPILEEIFFRGIILKKFLSKYTPLISIVVSSLLYAIFHLRPLGIVYLISYGLLFGFAYYLTKSLAVSVLLHMVINFMAFLTKSFSYDLNSRSVVLYVLFVSVSGLIIWLLVKYLINRIPVIRVKERNNLTWDENIENLAN